jgi:sugar phosphate isomerase/epimerase
LKFFRKEDLDMRKIGINMHAVRGLSDEEYVKTIKELGFGAVFTGVPSSETAKKWNELFAKYDIAWETMHSPFHHINDMWLDNEDGARMHQDLLHAVDMCAEAGVPITVIHLSSGFTPPDLTPLGHKRYDAIVEHAAKKGVTLAFENLRKLGNFAYFMERYENAPNVAFCWDNGHENCYTPDFEFMPLFHKRLVCTHLHDNDGGRGNDQHWLPFDGVVNFDRVAEHLRNSPFKGTLMLEVGCGDKNRYPNITSEAYLQRAADAIKRLRDMVEDK